MAEAGAVSVNGVHPEHGVVQTFDPAYHLLVLVIPGLGRRATLMVLIQGPSVGVIVRKGALMIKTRVPFQGFFKGFHKGSLIGFYIGALLLAF